MENESSHNDIANKQFVTIQTAITTLLCLILVFLRHPDQFFHPQFWIEDRDLYFYSSWSNLFDSVNGYLCLTHRLLISTLVATDLIPVEYHPIVAFFISIAIFSLIIIYFLLTPSRLPRISLFVLAIVLSPHYNSEVFVKFLYLIWIFPLSIFFLLFREPKNLPKSIEVIDIILLTFAGFSGPLIVILLPALIFVTFIYRNAYYLKLLFVGVLCSIIQVSYLINQSHKAVSPEVGFQKIIKIIEIFITNFLSQYLIPGEISTLGSGILLFLLFVSLIFSLKKGLLLDVGTLLIVFICTAFPPILKLYPDSKLLLNPVTSGSARYLFYPFLSISFYLLLVSIRGKLWGRLIAITLLLISFYNNIPGFQTSSFDYRWADHIRYAKQNNCNARIPISFTGKEGFAWVYESNASNQVTCSNYDISAWKDKNGNIAVTLEDGKIILKNHLDRAVFSPTNEIFTRDNTFVDFALSISIDPKQKIKAGFIFYDSGGKEIKITADVVIYSPVPAYYSYSASIPNGASMVSPYVHILSNSSTVTISKPSVLLFK